jgi:hypothetical protein
VSRSWPGDMNRTPVQIHRDQSLQVLRPAVARVGCKRHRPSVPEVSPGITPPEVARIAGLGETGNSAASFQAHWLRRENARIRGTFRVKGGASSIAGAGATALGQQSGVGATQVRAQGLSAKRCFHSRDVGCSTSLARWVSMRWSRICRFTRPCERPAVLLAEIRDLLGHSTVMMTERYAHLSPDDIRATVGWLDGLRGCPKDVPVGTANDTAGPEG